MREAAGKASGMSAQKFYVKTRMAEAAKSGKTLNAKDLRQKFQSGDVARRGFGAPIKKKKTATNASSAKPAIRTNNTSGRRAYGGIPQKAPKLNGGRFMQSADTGEAAKARYARIGRELQPTIIIGSKVPKNYKPNSNYSSNIRARGKRQ